MEIKEVKYFIVVLAMVFSVKALSANTGSAVPSNLHVYSAGGTTYVDHSAHGCANGRYYIPQGHPQFQTIVSILLTAQVAKKEVVIRYDECNTNNQGIVIGVYLRD